MRLVLFVVILCIGSAAALPAYLAKYRFAADAPVGTYQKPGPGDQRSPCPALNTLANHGHLPRNGQGITLDQLKKAFTGVLRCSDAFGPAFADLAFNKFKGANGTMDLNTLVKPQEDGGIEHFVSLTRLDVPRPLKPGTLAGPPDTKRIDSELAAIKKTDPKAIITTADMAAVRKFLEDNDKAVKVPAIHKAIAMAEACLLLGVLNGDKGMTSEAYKTFLGQEKFPDGWKPNNYLGGFGFTNIFGCLTEMGLTKLGLDIAQLPYFDKIAHLFGKK